MAEKTVNFFELSHFSPKQQEALYATEQYKFTLYGGSMGAGKSYWLRWSCIYWLLKLAAETKQPGIRAALFCEDYGALNDRHISKVKTEFPAALGSYNEQRHEFQLNPHFGGGILAFRNLDDPSKYLSSEFAVIAVDEVIKNSKDTFNILRTRLRWMGVRRPVWLGATNPGEGWVKQYWIDRAFSPSEQEPKEFFYVAALPKDNPYLPKEYFASLESLPEAERKAYLEGDWSAFERNLDDDGYQPLLSSSEIKNAYMESPMHVGYSSLAIDPAGGGDNSAIVLCSNFCAQIMFNQKTNDVMTLVPQVVGISQSYENLRIIYVDQTGIGKGLLDRLKEIFKNHPTIKVKGVSFGGMTSDKKMFTNLKDEMYWNFRNWILRGGKLVRDDGWVSELSSIRFKEASASIHIQSKDEMRRRGFKSPNCVDAAVMTMLAPNFEKRELAAAHPWSDRIDRNWKGL
jgi:hypothetical protein